MNKTFTPAEIDRLVKDNESFQGKTTDFEKMRMYHELKDVCTALLQSADCVKRMEEVPPRHDHRHAVVALDVDKACWFTGNEYALFKRAVELSDDFMLFARGQMPRISFTVMDVWEN